MEVTADQAVALGIGSRGAPLPLPMEDARVRPRKLTIKYCLDVVFAAVLLAVLAVVLLCIALAVRTASPGPVLYRQRRVGRDGREFELLKFRTMVGHPDEHGEADLAWALSECGVPELAIPSVQDRSTGLGRFLRRYCLDELPQLVNVLRGEMSFIGPRPERTSYVRTFTGHIHRYDERHRVRPGITGWAQVHGLRGATSLKDRVRADNWYIEHWSFLLDLKVAAKTIPAVFRDR